MSEQSVQGPKNVELVKGDYLFEEGNDASFAYVLNEGSVEIVRASAEGEQILGKVEKGSIFGEMAIIDGSPRSASARAASDCKVQEVDKKAFLQYLSKKPELLGSIKGQDMIKLICMITIGIVVVMTLLNSLNIVDVNIRDYFRLELR